MFEQNLKLRNNEVVFSWRNLLSLICVNITTIIFIIFLENVNKTSTGVNMHVVNIARQHGCSIAVLYCSVVADVVTEHRVAW